MLKKYKLKWSRTAQYDLGAIYLYYVGQVLSEIAEKISLQILNTVNTAVLKFPWSGQAFYGPANKAHLNCRSIIADTYKIFYLIHENQIQVVAVLDMRRNIDDIMAERADHFKHLIG